MTTEPTSWHDVAPTSIRLTPLATSARVDLQTLAKEQGVAPLADPDVLRGDFWPEDESIEDFLTALRTSRRDAAP
jgi:hypothetical protein